MRSSRSIRFRAKFYGFYEGMCQGYLYITGRIKEQYKLENGKYVVPAPLEEPLQLSPYIVQMYVDGANRPYNAALVVADGPALKKWAAAQGFGGTPEDLLAREDTKELIAGELAKYGADFKGYERIRELALISEELTTANGMLTPPSSSSAARS